MAFVHRNAAARVLIADDDEAQRDVVREILEGEGYTVEVAETPESTLSSSHQFRPDVVMLDLHGIATPEVMEGLRAISPMPGLVLFSGESRIKALVAEMGIDVGLPKPSDLDELLGAVSKALEAGDARAQAHEASAQPSL